jgi:DNA-binding GntR family transcriptional regulator
MSPVQAMDRSYAALRDLLRQGAYAPGHRLEANRLADEIGVSMTPVRDALNRLVGEQLVEASSGDGFHVPRLSESDLRDLYEWNSALAIIAARTARTVPDAGALQEVTACGSLADATSAAFELLAASVPNREVRDAIARIGDRLHPYRIAEDQALAPVIGELEAILLDAPRRNAAIRRYHLARMRAVGELLRARTKIIRL